MLILARAGEGELPVRAEPLEAREALAAVAARFGERAAAREREIAIDARPSFSSKRTRCGCARRSGTSSTTRFARRGRISLIAARKRWSSSRWPTTARDFRTDRRARFERFTGGDEAEAAPAPGSASRSCGNAHAHGGRVEIDDRAHNARAPDRLSGCSQ